MRCGSLANHPAIGTGAGRVKGSLKTRLFQPRRPGNPEQIKVRAEAGRVFLRSDAASARDRSRASGTDTNRLCLRLSDAIALHARDASQHGLFGQIKLPCAPSPDRGVPLCPGAGVRCRGTRGGSVLAQLWVALSIHLVVLRRHCDYLLVCRPRLVGSFSLLPGNEPLLCSP
jgi:hypothetical protein